MKTFYKYVYCLRRVLICDSFLTIVFGRQSKVSEFTFICYTITKTGAKKKKIQILDDERNINKL